MVGSAVARRVARHCDADVRVGGSYRYVLRAGSGHDMAFTGEYLEVTPPSRLVFTQMFEPTAAGPQPGDEAITITVTFDERDGEDPFPVANRLSIAGSCATSSSRPAWKAACARRWTGSKPSCSP